MFDFLKYIHNHLVLADGAMGTLIYQRGIFVDKCYDALNLTHPELIRSIHTEYAEAGAIVLESNTFGANRFKLASHNLQDKLFEINQKGMELAKEAAGEERYAAGSIGPAGIRLKPAGEITEKQAFDAFLEQASVLAGAGADLLIIETFSDIREMEQAIAAAKNVSELPVIAQMAIQEDGKTMYGVDVREAIQRMDSAGADVVGINCATGPKSILDFLDCISGITAKPVSVMPNAGLPQMVDGRTFYMSTPEYFGIYAKRFIEAGARMIGGCCGTTPEHIKKMAGSLAQKETRLSTSSKTMVSVKTEMKLPDPVPAAEKSAFAKKITQGAHVFLVEMVAPKGIDTQKQEKGAALLWESGVDAVNIPDGPRASARMSALALALIFERKGIETILHYTCRDRNILGIQSDLLGAYALGIKNILAVTGDPPMMGDYPSATAVFDIDSIGLVKLIHNLNSGLDIGNRPIGKPAGYFTGVGADPNAVNLQREIERYHRKVEAGAEYVITQPVFDTEALFRFMDQIEKPAIPFIAGIWPLVSYRNAEFMRNEVPGVSVPDSVMERMARFEDKKDQLKTGIEIAREMAEKVRSKTAGIQVSAPFGKVETALAAAGKTDIV